MHNKLKIIYICDVKQRVLTINFKPMTKEEREELVQQKENLKLLFEFPYRERVIKEDPQFEQYINDILDMIAEIEEKLKTEMITRPLLGRAQKNIYERLIKISTDRRYAGMF